MMCYGLISSIIFFLLVHIVIVHLIVVGLFDSKSCGNCHVPPPVGSSKVAFRMEKDGVKWPAELPAVLHLTRLSSLPCNGSSKGHSPLMESQEQGSKGSIRAFTPSYNGVLQALGELRKARSHWPYKTQPFSSQRAALCHSSSGCKQPAPSPVGLIRRKSHADTASVRFIGRKSGAHWINRRPKEQAWNMAGTSPDGGPLEQSDQDAGHHCCYGLLTKTNPNVPSALSPGSKDKAPVRSTWSDCQVTELPMSWPPGNGA